MDQPGTPPPVKKRRFFNDPIPHAKKITRSPTPEQDIDVAAQELEAYGLSSDPVIPVVEGPAHESGAGEDGFDTALFTSIIGEELPATALTRLRQISGGNMERGTFPSTPTSTYYFTMVTHKYPFGDS